MRILIISFYYEPDLSAGSFRTSGFVKSLRHYLGDQDSIEILTSMPNRYKTFDVEAEKEEVSGNIRIKRINIFSHKNSFHGQALAFLIYFLKTLRHTHSKEYDIVFATSSRLFSAFLGAIIAKQKNIPLYLDIRDIFVDTMISILKKSKLKFIVPFFLLVEKFTINSANKVNLISKGFLPYFMRKYKKCLYSFFPNGIDNEFLDFDYGAIRQISLNRRLVLTYTGNIGEGQGLEKIVPKIAQKYKNIEFRIIGDGGTKSILKRHTSNLENVKLLDPVERKELLKFYKESDALFLHLNDYDAFKKVLPSKIFEYAATYKPIVAGVDGYAREFLETNLPGCLIFKPSDFDDFCQKFAHFSGAIDIEKRKDFINKFSRCSIMNKMVEDFLNLTTVSI